MKKMTFAIITLVTAMAMPTMAMAAAPIAPAIPQITAPTATAAATTPTQVTAPTAAAPVTATDPTQVMVTLNGVEMTQAQARLIILANIKNHKQMSAEEMVNYINGLEAQSLQADGVAPVTPPAPAPLQ
jgi:hypothetical protein